LAEPERCLAKLLDVHEQFPITMFFQELMNTQGYYVGAYQFRSSPPPHRADVGWSWFLKDDNKVHIPALPSTYIWRPGQPNDHGGNIDERAAAIVRSGGLDDVSADLKLPYICEYSD
jgi:hypothetical protein